MTDLHVKDFPSTFAILKKHFETFLKILGFQKSFTKLLLYWKAQNFRIFYYWKSKEKVNKLNV